MTIRGTGTSPNVTGARLGVATSLLVLIWSVAVVSGCVPRPAPEPSVSPASTAGSATAITETPVTGHEVLLFSSDRLGNGEVFVASPGAEPINLTHHPAGDWDATWSPTCSDPASTCRIAFTSHRSGDSEVWVMDSTGRNLVNVTQHPAWDYWPAWSPDGRQIVFVSERDGDPELFIQSVGGGPATQITFNDESDRLPSWSADGRQIAFAAVRNDSEAIHLINTDGSHERPLTRWPLKATAPAWSPNGMEIAFVGWDQENRPGIYIQALNSRSARRVWETDGWIGSLSWSRGATTESGEGWLIFTAWQGGNHDLFALRPEGGEPLRVTHNPGWDDFGELRTDLALRPDNWLAAEALLAPPGARGRTQAMTPAADEFAFGFNIADLSKAYLTRDLGLNWAKGFVNWETVEPKRGHFRWGDPDNTVSVFQSLQLRVLLRIHGTPAWARPRDTFLTYPPDDMADFGHFVSELARRYRGQVAAYEIWNEPNLNYEWGYLTPDPVRYTLMLATAYEAIKAVDPDAWVISGGLATTGDGSPTAMGDIEFLRGMYRAGARGWFDGLGSHPYAFGKEPDYQDAWGLSLARVVGQRQVMLDYDDAATPIWITELGWVLRSSWNLEEHEQIGVSEAQQAQYLVRAYEKMRSEWPWVRGLFVFNLDFSVVPWYTAAEPMRWYAVLNPDRTPRPAYTAIKNLISTAK